jgi:hypothetical protein
VAVVEDVDEEIKILILPESAPIATRPVTFVRHIGTCMVVRGMQLLSVLILLLLLRMLPVMV